MRLYCINTRDQRHNFAVERDGLLYALSDLGIHGGMDALMDKEHSDAWQALETFLHAEKEIPCKGIPVDQAAILAPIEYPKQDIICVGLNYYEHITETKHVEDFTRKEATVYFSKRVNRAIGMNEPIPDYDFVDSLDYEVELGVILGRDVKNYRRGLDPSPVFGYTIINDLSARNLQSKHKQWYVGKSLDGYTSMGPCIVTRDEIPDAGHLEITCTVNGEVRQHSNTKYMITDVDCILEELSQGITLKAGTILSTGTPGGVALGMKEPRYLKRGDVVECSIEGIGTLRNIVG